MSQDNLPETTEDLDETNESAVVKNQNDFDDDESTTTTEVKPPVEPPPPEAPVEDEEQEELVAPNNVHINKSVVMTSSPYKIIKRTKDGALLIVPKRVTRLTEARGAWDTDPKNTHEADILYVSQFTVGLEAQTSASYLKNEKGEKIGFYDRILDDPDASWEQGVTGPDGKVIYGRAPSLKISTERRSIGGQLARDRGLRSIGLGISGRKPLPHTGIHIDLGPRSTNEYNELDALLTMDKIKYGRDFNGLIYQNSQIHQVSRTWQFIQAGVRRVNIQNWEDLDLGDYIKCTDLPMLYWAQICTMFPDGYPLDLPCSSGINICKHIERILFDPNKGLWINTKKLARSQVERLNKDNHQMSFNDLELYQEHNVSPFTREIRVNDTCVIVLEVPTINQYINAGEEWLAYMNARIIELFGNDKYHTPEVQKFIDDSLEQAVVREYAHWVKEIVYYGTDVVEGKEDIANNLSDLSTLSHETTQDVMGEIQKFIEDATIAIVALPNFACPVCEKDYVTEEHSKHPDLIPLDILKHFFTVKDLRLTIPMKKLGG